MDAVARRLAERTQEGLKRAGLWDVRGHIEGQEFRRYGLRVGYPKAGAWDAECERNADKAINAFVMALKCDELRAFEMVAGDVGMPGGERGLEITVTAH